MEEIKESLHTSYALVPKPPALLLHDPAWLTIVAAHRKTVREEKLDSLRAMEAADQSTAALEHKCVALDDAVEMQQLLACSRR